MPEITFRQAKEFQTLKTKYNLKEIEAYVYDNLKKEESYNTIQYLQNYYPETIFYIFGGAIRDILIKYFHNTKIKIRDFDIFIDDSKKYIKDEKFIKQVELLGFKHYFTPSGKPRCFKGKKFDLEFPLFSNNGFSGKKIESEKDIFLNLDFYHNAGIFDFKNKKLYIHETTLSSIESKTIILIKENKLTLNSIIAGRAILQKIRLNFSLDELLEKEIKKEIKNISFKDIEKYLCFKKYKHYNKKVKEKLKKLKNIH